jgi:hypothetical protein
MAASGRARAWWALSLGAILVTLVSTLHAQSPARRAINLSALLAYPSFYHTQPIVLVGALSLQPNGEFRVADQSGSIRVIPDGPAPEGLDEIRGQFWDLGRMKADDPRLAGRDLRTTFHIDPDGAWPRPGDVTVIMATSVAPVVPTPVTASAPIRGIVLDASRFVDQTVTIIGQYEGRNLTGDLPDAPAKSRYDFVLRSADAAIWVTNIRPRGKDARGKDFELGLDARIDTGRWLQISGTVRQGRGLLWIDGQPDSLALAQAPSAPPNEDREPAVRVPAGPAPEVVFSTPTSDETDVPAGTSVRIQFSRDISVSSIKGHLKAAYLDRATGASAVPLDITTEYVAATRVVELRFAKPLERFRTVKIELTDGLVGTDQQAVKPWSLSFDVGAF